MEALTATTTFCSDGKELSNAVGTAVEPVVESMMLTALTGYRPVLGNGTKGSQISIGRGDVRALLSTLLFCFAVGLSAVAHPAFAQSTQSFTRSVIIRPGDTLTHIALREMGSAQLAQKLADHNEVELEKILKPGNTLFVPVSLPVRDEFATILFTKGSVLLNGNDAQADDKVRLNDSVATGPHGYASLEFQTGTLINLQPDTLARIIVLHCQPTDPTCLIEMAADKGTLTTDVRRDGDQPTDFRVQTPYASAAVRGTVFDIDSDATGLRIGVTEGNIDLTAANSDELVALDTGFGSASAPGSGLGEPIELLPAPVFRFVPPRLAKGDTLRWFGLTDTDQYIVKIAASPDGVGIVHDISVEEDSFVLNDDIPTGDYTVLVRAVGSQGLRGFIADSPITLAAIDENIAPVSASVEREGGFYRISVLDQVDEAAGYEVQVAADINFSDPVSVDVDESGVALVRLSSDGLFARTRVLIDRTTVGPFGEPTTLAR